MARLEDLTPGTLVKGIVPDATAELVSVKWHGSDVLEVVCKDSSGRLGTEILFRDREPSLQILTAGRPWSFDGDGKLFRHEEVQAKLKDTEWDLIVCGEAHKMSATFFGGEVKHTKRYHLGRLLSGLTRHFLLMTATPHNGKEEDFQLFMALLDGDRFEGKFRDGVHTTNTSDLMRRMVKERLLKFDGTPLFPERIAVYDRMLRQPHLRFVLADDAVYECATPSPRLARVQDPFGTLLAKAKGSVLISPRDILQAATKTS